MAELTQQEADGIVRAAIADVAPDIVEDLVTIDTDADLWELLDLDSMDHQNVMVVIAERTGIEVAERDYPRLRSLTQIAAHLAAVSGPARS